jgi:hypothetical protein
LDIPELEHFVDTLLFLCGSSRKRQGRGGYVITDTTVGRICDVLVSQMEGGVSEGTPAIVMDKIN